MVCEVKMEGGVIPWKFKSNKGNILRFIRCICLQLYNGLSCLPFREDVSGSVLQQQQQQRHKFAIIDHVRRYMITGKGDSLFWYKLENVVNRVASLNKYRY